MYHELPGPHGEFAKVPALTHYSSHNSFHDKELRALTRCVSRQAVDCVRIQRPLCPVLGRAHGDGTVHAPRPQELWCGVSFSNDFCSRTDSIKSTTVLSVDLTPERHILATGSDGSQVQIDEPPLLATGSGDRQARICGPFYSLPFMGTNHRLLQGATPTSRMPVEKPPIPRMLIEYAGMSIEDPRVFPTTGVIILTCVFSISLGFLPNIHIVPCYIVPCKSPHTTPLGTPTSC